VRKWKQSLNPAHLGTDTGVTIFVKGRGWNLLTLGVTYRVKNYTPLGNINRGVLKEVVEENLDNKSVFI
jgi:hypothetical protein